MARRPPIVSVASLASSRAPLEPPRLSGAPPVLSPLATKLSPRVTSQLGALTPTKSLNDVVDFDPDELFEKYTITEVRARQAQLRADAEAKQEDLRIMVGERYRDLLQASSSIISIATSAKRVQQALEETVTTIRSQRVPTTQNHVSQGRKDGELLLDSHLQVLQILSAHIKLLLDAPEHLWRLIEREKYFQAAWLFLLARVVYRALIRDDAEEDENWTQHGINVLEQFPLIQRQWETVSHFRAQIIHKATLSLRLYEKTSEQTCATLLTLHILDSRPLAETLMIYLSQRTRTLNTLLAKSLDTLEPRGNGFPANGVPSEGRNISQRPSLPTSTVALSVKNAIKTTLEALSRTLYTARAVFGTSASARSLAESVLDNIPSERPCIPTTFPAELLLNTQTILSSLPSSGYVSLLLADIRSYRPFVDPLSASSSLPQEVLCDKLGSWFDQFAAKLGGTFDKWLASLDVVSDVWKVRTSLRKQVAQLDLLAPEIANLTKLLDEVFRTRITGIWKAMLVRSEEVFSEALGSLGSGSENDMFSPLCNLYRSLPVLQPTTGAGPASFDTSFNEYKATLTQRLGGRAPELHKTLQILEDVASSLQRDLAKMYADGGSSEQLVVDLTAAYSPEAQALCVRVVSALKVSSEELMASPDVGALIGRLVFYAHTAKELSMSPFVCNIGCNQTVATSFREEMNMLFQRIMSCWEEHVISKLVSYYAQKAWHTYPSPTCSHPSPPMMECLYLLSSSIHNLGMSHYQPYLKTMPQRMIVNFSASFVRSVGDGDIQVLYDLTLLRHLASKWKNAEVTLLGEAIDELRSRVGDSLKEDPDRSAVNCLSGTQMLISALLPYTPNGCENAPKEEDGDKTAGMLTYGVPVVDAQFVPAIELAPPSSRFPLLLTDSR